MVLVIIGIPVWWFTTRVYRAPLPIDQMQDIEIQQRIDKEFGLLLSLEYDVLISVVHPEPENMKLELNAADLGAALQPFVSTVAPVTNLTVKSQWLYMVDLGVIPRKLKGHYALYEDQLPHIITPLEKKLWSHLSPRPCINLVIYVSRCDVPILIHTKQDQILNTNSFLSPRWGGILIINPDKSACHNHVFKPDIKTVASAFVSQLRKLLGIEGSSELDLDKYKVKKALDMIDSTKRTLKSLAQLLSEINSIVISDEVADKIKLAVEARDAAEAFMKNNDINAGLERAKVAFEHSERAFSDPSLLALLYFPDDQK